MLQRALAGAIAGAAGTVVLNAVTYADMTLRGRPSSSVPAAVAGKLAGQVGIDLSGGGGEDKAQNRQSGLGALLGIATGLGVGVAYGLVRPYLEEIPGPVAAAGLGLAAMAGSDVPATALGATNPCEWGVTSWVSDVVPHLAYGLAAVKTFDAVTRA